MGRTYRKRRRKPRNFVSSPEVEQLYSWIQKLGFRAECALRLAETPGSGRGLVCCRRIGKGDIVVDLPKNLLITPSQVRSKYGLGNCSFSAEEALAIFVLTEKRLEEHSNWKPYIDSLPDSFESPASNRMVEHLPRRLCLAIERWNGEARKSFSRLQEYFSEAGVKLSFEVFLWAWCVVNTRCIFVEGHGSTLAPFLDMLNHHWKATTQTNFVNDRFTIRSNDNYEVGEEVFINYGNHDNRTLFVNYGFVLDLNPNDCVTVELDHLEKLRLLKNISKFETKKAFFHQNELLTDQTGFTSEGATWNLKIVLQVLQSDTEQNWKKILLNAIRNDSLELERLLATQMLEDYTVTVPDSMLHKLLEIEKKILLCILSKKEEVT